MTAFVLIPGAGGTAWYWHRVSPFLQREGHEAIAVELPADDESMGLDDYADIVVRAVGERSDVILVAQSLEALLRRWSARGSPFACSSSSTRNRERHPGLRCQAYLPDLVDPKPPDMRVDLALADDGTGALSAPITVGSVRA